MSKLIDVNKLLNLNNYSKKYQISKRKIYRYVDGEKIDHVIIDGVPFVYDKPYDELQTDHRVKNGETNVKIVTKDLDNVKIVTKQEVKTPLNDSKNKENGNVKIVTKGNDKILTLEEERIINTPDVQLTGEDLVRKKEINKKLSHTST